ncbi:hypothetical protein OG948_18900 [Embleya sp. NBC_00888]|uniref:hypothetical protein n=1 Tax=Embleya sp. NBC_00888 TaxID=2975960 RepID=UPI00386AFF4A|nr:hypothetical protein OG948_18900 [Embleya sp. NBC_00888]
MDRARDPIVDAGGTYWYAMIPVDDAATALLCVPLGAVFLVAGFYTGPALLRAHARCTRSLPGPVAPARESVVPVVYAAA